MSRIQTDILGTPQVSSGSVPASQAGSFLAPAAALGNTINALGKAGAAYVRKREELDSYHRSLNIRTRLELAEAQAEESLAAAKNSTEYANAIAIYEDEIGQIQKEVPSIKNERYRADTQSAIERIGGVRRIQMEAGLTKKIDAEVFAEEKARIDEILAKGIISGEYDGAFAAISNRVDALSEVVSDDAEAQAILTEARSKLAFAAAGDELLEAAIDGRPPDFEGINGLLPWQAEQLKAQHDAHVRRYDREQDALVFEGIPRRLDRLTEIDDFFEQMDEVDAIVKDVMGTGVPDAKERAFGVRIQAQMAIAEKDLSRIWSAGEGFRYEAREKMYKDLAAQSRKNRDGMESAYLEIAESYRLAGEAYDNVVESGQADQVRDMGNVIKIAALEAIPLLDTSSHIPPSELRETMIDRLVKSSGIPREEFNSKRFPLGEGAWVILNQVMEAELSAYKKRWLPGRGGVSHKLSSLDSGARQLYADNEVAVRFNGFPAVDGLGDQELNDLKAFSNGIASGRIGMPAPMQIQLDNILADGGDTTLKNLYDLKTKGVDFTTKVSKESIGDLQYQYLARYIGTREEGVQHGPAMERLRSNQGQDVRRAQVAMGLKSMSDSAKREAMANLGRAMGIVHGTDFSKGATRNTIEKGLAEFLAQQINGDTLGTVPRGSEPSLESLIPTVAQRTPEILDQFLFEMSEFAHSDQPPDVLLSELQQAYDAVLPSAGRTYLSPNLNEDGEDSTWVTHSPESEYGLVSPNHREDGEAIEPDGAATAGILSALTRSMSLEFEENPVTSLQAIGVSSGQTVEIGSELADHLEGRGVMHFESGTPLSDFNRRLAHWVRSDMTTEEASRQFREYLDSGVFDVQAWSYLPGAGKTYGSSAWNSATKTKTDLRWIADNFEFVRGRRRPQDEIDAINKAADILRSQGHDAPLSKADYHVWDVYLLDENGRRVGPEGQGWKMEVSPTFQDLFGNYYAMRKMQLKEGKGWWAQRVDDLSTIGGVLWNRASDLKDETGKLLLGRKRFEIVPSEEK